MQKILQVWVIGDSLNDTGTFSPLTATGRFTNTPGLLWTEIVARHFGASVAPSYIFDGNEFQKFGGTNYAQSGALVTEENGLFDGKSWSVRKQVKMLTAEAADFANALLLMDGGGPNILRAAMTLGAGQLSPTDAVRQITEAGRDAGRLALEAANAGFAKVLWASVADFGKIPALGAGVGDAASFGRMLSQKFNQSFDETITSKPLNLIVVDLLELFDRWIANPQEYGLENVTDAGINQDAAAPTATGNSANANPSHQVSANAAYSYLFSDTIHPSARGHELLAKAVLQILEPV